MLQRNDGGYPLTLADPPTEIPPGATIEHPHPVAGLTPVEPEPDAEPPGKATTRRQRAGDDTPGEQL